MPQAEREAHADRVLALRHELAGGVIDRGQMVPVVAVLHARKVGRQHQAQCQRLTASCGSTEQKYDGGKMQCGHRTESEEQPGPERQ